MGQKFVDIWEKKTFKFVLDYTIVGSYSDWLRDGLLKDLKLEAGDYVLYLVQNSSVVSPAVGMGSLLPGVKGPRREVDHSPSSSVEINKNV